MNDDTFCGNHRTMTIAGVLLLLIPLIVRSDDTKVLGTGADTLPVFDAHMHYHEPAWDFISPEEVVGLMDRNNIPLSLLSSGPDEGTVRLFEFAPGRFVPELSPYHGSHTKSNWTRFDGMATYMESRLKKVPEHVGMGELLIHDVDVRNYRLLKQLATLAEERQLLMHIHADHEVITSMFKFAPSIKVIWAHAGMVDSPEVIDEMMTRYSQLYADLSHRERQILRGSGDAMDKEWKSLLLKHADRFMIGSDTWTNSSWSHYDSLINTNRRWLAMMPEKEATMIAFQNAEKLFNIKIAK